MSKETESIHSVEDVFTMLDSFFREEEKWWNKFYNKRDKDVPFFVNAPDENLVHYFTNLNIDVDKVLELGCGPGRNAIYMAEQGCNVDAVDISESAISWARERTANTDNVHFYHSSIFEYKMIANTYDFIYDCGCFHHLLPHRRFAFLDILKTGLKPGGYFGLVCFAESDMGADLSDWEVYRQLSLKGGLGYSEKKLKSIFSEFEIVELRRMKKMTQPGPLFGESFMWTALFRKSKLNEPSR